MKDQRKNEPQNMASPSALGIPNWREPGAAARPALRAKPEPSSAPHGPRRGRSVARSSLGLRSRRKQTGAHVLPASGRPGSRPQGRPADAAGCPEEVAFALGPGGRIGFLTH